jgi:Protein tyrosine and serine/threonine kinase
MGEGDRLGQQVGNYRLERLLGSGGFADVYLGRRVYLDSQAAIKLLRASLTQEEVEDFRQEARTLARLIHPHIVRILDFGLQGNAPFLVMDYAPMARCASGTGLGNSELLIAWVGSRAAGKPGRPVRAEAVSGSL